MKEKELNEFEKSVYLIDMVEGFVNTGAIYVNNYEDLKIKELRKGMR